MKKFLALLMTVVLCLSLFAACAEKEEKKKIVIGMTKYQPICYDDENGELTGFDVEFARLAGEKLGYEIEFKEIVWADKYISLNSGDIDCIWNGLTITDEAKANADCTKPYALNSQVVVMAADKCKDYNTVESLKDLKFCAERGSAGEGLIKDNELTNGYKDVDTQMDAMMEVLSKHADACVVDIAIAKLTQDKNGSYASLGMAVNLNEELFGIAFRKGDILKDKLNEVIDEFMKDGTLQKLADKYGMTLA